jgi:integrase
MRRQDSRRAAKPPSAGSAFGRWLPFSPVLLLAFVLAVTASLTASPRTVLQFHCILRQAFQQAVKWQLLARNPADAIEPPRADKPQQQALCPDRSMHLLEAAAGTSLHLSMLVAATTGMRRGEICALKWEDVTLRADTDPPTGVVRVRRPLEVTKEGLRFKQPKTAKGRRSLTLPALAVEALDRHREEQAQQRALLGSAWKEHGLIVSEPDSSPRNPDLPS